jgi:nucleoside-diphosphate-sugar epimerase
MQVLIIGGTGVLSRSIAQFAIISGHEVTILTNGLGELPVPMGIKQHLIVDRNDHTAFQSELAKANVAKWDLVVDAICYNEHQAESLLTVIQDKSEHTIIISTAIIYDPKLDGILTPDSPIASDLELGKYGREKVKMETVWMNAWRTNQHPVTILRPPHIIGEGALLGVVPLHNRDPYLISRLSNQQPLIVADGGRQIIQVVFNEDIVKVIFMACGKSRTFGKIYNCANPQLLTGRKYFEAIAHLINVPLSIKNIPSEVIWKSNWGWSSTTVSRILSMNSLYEDIGFIPNTPLEVAIKVSLNYLLMNSQAQIDSPNIHLKKINDELERSHNSLKLSLTNYEKERLKSSVDLRMNTDPPQYER